MATILTDLVSHLQAGEALAINDAVYINSADGKVYKYSPLDPTQVFAGIAKEAGLLNAFIRVVQSGRVKGFTGLTPGAFVYASVTVPGGFQLTEPGSTLKVVLGIAKSATELTVNGALGIKTGGDGTGSGSLDTILQLTATEQLTDWSTGNNATVLGGGSLAGTFVKETSTPLHGSESYKYTQAAGSLNDYFLSKSFPVDIRFRGQQVYFSAPIQYNGNTGDIQIVIYDVTNSTVLTTLSNSIIATNGATQTVIASALLPLTCANIRVGFQVKVLNSGKILSFDDIQVGQSLYQAAQLNNVTDWQDAGLVAADFQGFGTPTAIQIQSRREGTELVYRGRFVSGTPTAVEARLKLKFNGSALTSVSNTANGIPLIQKAGEWATNAVTAIYGTHLIEPSVTYITFGFQSGSQAGLTKQNGNTLTSSGNIITINARIPINGWSAGNTAIVTPTQQISSDTLPFTFKATAIVDADPIGTFNTYTYAANTNTATISASAPTQTVASMNIDGFRVFARAYNVASTTANPARVDIKIGKGLKGKSLELYKSAGKVTAGSLDVVLRGTAIQHGVSFKDYNEVTGILTVDCGYAWDSSVTSNTLLFNDATAQTSGYLTINASTTPSIAALPILQPRIAYLSDVKANGTAGGSSSAATTHTRTLNTIVDPTGIVTSLTANQFILPAGTYDIFATAPALSSNGHKIRLRNITDSTNSIIGSSELTDSVVTVQTISNLSGQITINASKTFELQHYIATARAINGLGGQVGNGDVETFAQVKITKVR